jgi:formylglycine-generating enzyme required for sulfatase activity
MRNIQNYISLFFLAGMVGCSNTEKVSNNYELQPFVCIKGSVIQRGDQQINIGDFEIQDHPVTNAEYKHFVDATGYRAPSHWEKEKIPAGKEDYPVIYVNREDVETYTNWLTQTTGRIYRIPTRHEFEYAARSRNESRFFWGNNDLEAISENINYNDKRNRKYDRWEDYLKPAVW